MTRSFTSPTRLGAALAIAISALSSAPVLAQAPLYSVTPIAGMVFVTGINDLGQVCGNSLDDMDKHTSGIWIKGTAPNGTFYPAPKYLAADGVTLLSPTLWGISENGYVAGDGGGAIRWSIGETSLTFCNSPQNGTGTNGRAVNTNGFVTGFAFISLGPSQPPAHSFIYRQDVSPYSFDLGFLPGNSSSTQSQGWAINDNNRIVGFEGDTSSNVNDAVAFVWTPSAGKISLGSGFARCINNKNLIAGNSPATYGNACFWKNGVKIPITNADGTNFGGTVYGINEAGNVVGAFGPSPNVSAAFVRIGYGIYNLNNCIQATPANANIKFTGAYDINNNGAIVVNGTDALGERQAYLLTPL